MNTLDFIANKYGTDKCHQIHNYCARYEKYLPFNRYDKLKILEIGVLNGESLKTWREYFYRSEIVGIDINPDCKQYEGERISVEIGSQDDAAFLTSVNSTYGDFDLILDDGSHLNSHVIKSFDVLFPLLKSGGTYVVEDVLTSYLPDYEGGFRQENTSMEYFKRLADDVNYRGLLSLEFHNVHARREDKLNPYSKKVQPDCRIDIESITFLNGIIIIRKK
jgi:hypothetical protein